MNGTCDGSSFQAHACWGGAGESWIAGPTLLPATHSRIYVRTRPIQRPCARTHMRSASSHLLTHAHTCTKANMKARTHPRVRAPECVPCMRALFFSTHACPHAPLSHARTHSCHTQTAEHIPDAHTHTRTAHTARREVRDWPPTNPSKMLRLKPLTRASFLVSHVPWRGWMVPSSKSTNAWTYTSVSPQGIRPGQFPS